MHHRILSPASTDRSEEFQLADWDHLGLSPRRIEQWLWALVALGIALRLLDLKHIRVANLLPALVLAPVLLRLFP